MPRPRLRTGAPRLRPSVGFMAMARTRLSPMCWATSATIVVVSPSTSVSNSRAQLISGRLSGGNSTSTTGPTMATMRPSLRPVWPAWAVTLTALLADSRLLRVVVVVLACWPWAMPSAPPTISMISVVMVSWRARLAIRSRLVISSLALSVADFMARCRAACSDAAASSRAAKSRPST